MSHLVTEREGYRPVGEGGVVLLHPDRAVGACAPVADPVSSVIGVRTGLGHGDSVLLDR